MGMKLSCQECKGNVEMLHGEFTCTKCGLVIGAEIYSGSRVV